MNLQEVDMFDDRIVHQYIVNNTNDDELVRQL